MIDRDDQRRIVFAARRRCGCGKRGSVTPAAVASVSSSQSPECCWRVQGDGMVRHQQFDQCLARRLTCSVVGLHLHAGLDLPDAGGGIHALADIHDTNAADAHRIFVLLVAKSGNRDAVQPRGIEDGRARGNRDTGLPSMVSWMSGAGFGTHAVPRLGKQTPAGQRRCATCSSTTSRKMLQHRLRSARERPGPGRRWKSASWRAKVHRAVGRSVLAERAFASSPSAFRPFFASPRGRERTCRRIRCDRSARRSAPCRACSGLRRRPRWRRSRPSSRLRPPRSNRAADRPSRRADIRKTGPKARRPAACGRPRMPPACS